MDAINKNYIAVKMQKINALRDLHDENVKGFYLAPSDNAQYIHFMQEFLSRHTDVPALINDRFIDQSQEFSNLPLDVFVLRKDEVDFIKGTVANAPHTTLHAYYETDHTVH